MAKFTRTVGESVTNSADADSDTKLERRLRVDRKGIGRTNSPELQDIGSFLVNDAEFALRQYIAVIDKIYQKPESLQGITRPWYQAREALGVACWAEIVVRHPTLSSDEMAKLQKKWRWKVHPYADKADAQADLRAIAANGDKVSKGQWYDTFYGNNQSDAEVAKAITAHLFTARRRLANKDAASPLEQASSTKGLVLDRAKAVTQSVPPTSSLSIMDVITDQDWAQYVTPDIAKTIYETALESEAATDPRGRPRPRRINSKEIGRAFYRHYSDVGLNNPEFTGDKWSQMNELHKHVRRFYHDLIGKSKRGTKQHRDENIQSRISSRMPKNADALRRRLDLRSANSSINTLIREGRAAYFSTLEDGNPEKQGSFYRTSAGIMEAKRIEAFARIWRTAKDQAARTLKDWADPTSSVTDELGDDIIGSGHLLTRVAGVDFDDEAYTAKLPILFGKRAELFTGIGDVERADVGSGLEKRRNILLAALKITRNIRNDTAHYQHRSAFVKTLKKSLSTITEGTAQNDRDAVIAAETQQFINQLYVSDHAERRARTQAELTGAGLHKYVEQRFAKQFLSKIENAEPASFALPRFNRVLERLENTRSFIKPQDDRSRLPGRATQQGLKDGWARLRFVAMKKAYEALFGTWLEKQTADEKTLTAWTDKVIAESSVLARAPQQQSPFRELIEAKIAQLQLDTSNGVKGLFEALAGEIGRELRQQNAYAANPEKARDESEWIEDFKCDFVGYAFARFLGDRDVRLRWLLSTQPENAPSGQKPEDVALSSTPEKFQFETWEANLYFFMHFVPVGDVSRILNQLEKADVLERRASPNTAGDASEASEPEPETPRSEFKTLKKVLNLYREMYNDKFEGTVQPIDLSEFAPLFASSEDFERIHNTVPQTGASDISLKRGLRQIIRFGHLQTIMPVFAQHPINAGEIDAILAAESRKGRDQSDLEQWHAERQTLHKGFVRNRPEEAQFTRYGELLSRIEAHKHGSNDARLITHAKLHDLLMQVYSRLLNYAVNWERDRLFVMLGMLAQQEANGERGAEDAPAPKKIKEFIKEKHNRYVTETGPDGKTDQSVAQMDVWARKYLTDANRASFQKAFTTSAAKTRNNLAHYNTLQPGQFRNLTDLVNDVRDMMAYDRKQRNRVAKTVIDLLAREGLILKWRVGADHELAHPEITTALIRHFEKVRGLRILIENQHSERFVVMANALFQTKSASETG